MPITAIHEPPTFNNNDNDNDNDNGNDKLYYSQDRRLSILSPTLAVIPNLKPSRDHDDVIQHVSIVVSSVAVTLWNAESGHGIVIPLANLIIFATQREPDFGVYVQFENVPFTLDKNDDGNDDDDNNNHDLDLLELVIPPQDSSTSAEAKRLDSSTLFDALAKARELHDANSPPESHEDYNDHDNHDDYDIFSPNHQWITADNVDQFQDDASDADEIYQSKFRRIV
ncbi:hypothetical protein V1514DRAFT_324621 [Lipomyces japonicus]|uniref:uncharacterized protein n=1 Tax=Lipomyces japonicus TaxID=56871 RepID=UPI0034CDD2DD